MVEKDMGDGVFDHEMNQVSSMVVKMGKGVSSMVVEKDTGYGGLSHQMRLVGSMVVEKDNEDTVHQKETGEFKSADRQENTDLMYSGRNNAEAELIRKEMGENEDSTERDEEDSSGQGRKRKRSRSFEEEMGNKKSKRKGKKGGKKSEKSNIDNFALDSEEEIVLERAKQKKILLAAMTKKEKNRISSKKRRDERSVREKEMEKEIKHLRNQLEIARKVLKGVNEYHSSYGLMGLTTEKSKKAVKDWVNRGA